MLKAILTIDDIASKNTPALVDYLNSKGIRPVMFAVGENVERYYDEAVYALKNGMVVGNHSYSHPHFSQIPFEEGVEDILKCDWILDKLYADAGVTRSFRPFRFPYGDKGGEHKDEYQKFFKTHGFDKLSDREVTYEWWPESGLDKDIDTFWTFDFAEYNIRKGSGFTVQNVWDRINDKAPQNGGSVFYENSLNILLLHAHDETEELVPGYYAKFLDYLLENGVKFEKPEFFRPV